MAYQPDQINDDEKETVPTVRELKSLATNLYNAIKQSTLVPEGFGKLKRKVSKELQHLETLDENATYNSSNIHYLNSIWRTLVDEGNNVCGVFKKYKYISEINAKKSELIVDIVCDDGLRWIKVKTSNPYSMQLQFINYGSSSKSKNIITMADNFITASNQHKVYFQAPKIQFVFVEGITSDLAYILKQKCIIIKGKEIKDDFLYVDDELIEDKSEEENDVKQIENQKNGDKLDETCVNLGVRTMLTMISSLSNGEINKDFFYELQSSLREMDKLHDKETNDKAINNLDFEYYDFPKKNGCINDLNCIQNGAKNEVKNKNKNKLNANGYTFGHVSMIRKSATSRRKKFSEKSYEEKKMLLQMFIDEISSPVLPTIIKCIANKKLICCEAAWNHFIDIVNLSAGENEWKRCHELQEKITIVKDKISARTELLTGKSMSRINKSVFGTGDSLKIITLTAIASFVRKAQQQGVKYFVHIHPVRPLTERYQMEYEKQKKQNIKPKKDADANINESDDDGENLLVVD